MENKYLKQAHKGKTESWRYLLGVLMAFFASILFGLPYNTVIAQKVAIGVADGSKIGDYYYLMSLLDSNTTLIYLMLPFLGGLLALYFIITKLHKLSWTNFNTSRNKIDIKRIVFSFVLWGSISAIVVLSGVILNPETVLLNFNLPKFLVLLVVAMAMVPIQTSFEEYMFRGYLMQGLGVVTKTKWLPLTITSITFGLMHLSNPEVATLGYGIMVFYIGTGFLLGIITLMDEGTELALGFHAANNLITALLVTTNWTAFQTHAIFRDVGVPNIFIELGVMAVLYPLLLFVFAKKYQWKNWKEKLV